MSATRWKFICVYCIFRMIYCGTYTGSVGSLRPNTGNVPQHECIHTFMNVYRALQMYSYTWYTFIFRVPDCYLADHILVQLAQWEGEEPDKLKGVCTEIRSLIGGIKKRAAASAKEKEAEAVVGGVGGSSSSGSSSTGKGHRAR
jgi:hypothetical protein